MRNDKEIYLEKEKTRSGIAAIPGGRVHTHFARQSDHFTNQIIPGRLFSPWIWAETAAGAIH